VRRWLALAVLANLLVQPVLPVAMAELLLAHAGEHAHSISLAADAGHYDLVLSHEPAEPHEHAPGEPAHAAHASARGDHVVHLSHETESWQTRRLTGDDAPALMPTLRLPAPFAASAPANAVVAAPPRDLRASRTVVLLL
jgi:hypothetical protein